MNPYVIAIAALFLLGAVLYYRDRQRVLAIREREIAVDEKRVQAALISAEAGKLNAVTRRADFLLYDEGQKMLDLAEEKIDNI